ncbi:MAG: T9SS type A sorting domain-containing protein [Flavobacteriales bacterium]|nr:T9SS type A sorting domain-containing protein [Flavobacteriales bacterium]
MNEENALANSLIVFPNPSNGLVNVAYTTAASTQATFQVRNVLGEVVMSVNQSIGAGAQRQTLDMGALSNGMYELTITADGLRASRKVSLNK